MGLLSGGGLGAADQSARQRAGVLAGGVGLDAGDDRVEVAVRSLEDSAATGREVVGELRATDREAVVVDDVQVGAVARGENAAIEQANRASGVAGLALDQELERDSTLGPLAAPVLQQRGGERSVADGADMSSAVAQGRDREVMRQKIAGAVEVHLAVVGER